MPILQRVQTAYLAAVAARLGTTPDALPPTLWPVLLQIITSIFSSGILSNLCGGAGTTPPAPATILGFARRRHRKARQAIRWATSGADLPAGIGEWAVEEGLLDVAPAFSETDVGDLQAAVAV